jgi:CheY-like chemotaxis protein
LGLSSVFSIVRKHQGQINVESTLGVGTTFTFYLPANAESEVKEMRTEPDIEKDRQGRILVMDDDEILQQCVSDLLSGLGYEAVTVGDGEEACEVYQQALQDGEIFDSVILDLTIRGGMGGKETIVKLKKMDPKIKAIVSSGYSADPIMARPSTYGFSAVLAKPYTLESLARVLDSLNSENNQIEEVQIPPQGAESSIRSELS